MKKLLFLVSGLILFFSCTNEEASQPHQNAISYNLKAKEASGIPKLTNNDTIIQYFNYYLSVSYLHSNGLNQVRDYLIANKKNASYSGLRTVVRDYSAKNGISIDPGQPGDTSTFMHFLLKDSNAENQANQRQLSALLVKYTPVFATFFNTIEKAVISKPSIKKEELVSLFQKSLVSSDFKKSDPIAQQSLLLASAIYVDSYFYWTNTKNTDLWGPAFPVTIGGGTLVTTGWPPTRADIIRYVKIDAIGAGVGAVGGAVGGAAYGAVTALLTGGVLSPAILVGAVAGAIGGSISGAITASGTAALMDYYGL